MFMSACLESPGGLANVYLLVVATACLVDHTCFVEFVDLVLGPGAEEAFEGLRGFVDRFDVVFSEKFSCVFGECWDVRDCYYADGIWVFSGGFGTFF